MTYGASLAAILVETATAQINAQSTDTPRVRIITDLRGEAPVSTSGQTTLEPAPKTIVKSAPKLEADAEQDEPQMPEPQQAASRPNTNRGTPRMQVMLDLRARGAEGVSLAIEAGMEPLLAPEVKPMAAPTLPIAEPIVTEPPVTKSKPVKLSDIVKANPRPKPDIQPLEKLPKPAPIQTIKPKLVEEAKTKKVTEPQPMESANDSATQADLWVQTQAAIERTKVLAGFLDAPTYLDLRQKLKAETAPSDAYSLWYRVNITALDEVRSDKKSLYGKKKIDFVRLDYGDGFVSRTEKNKRTIYDFDFQRLLRLVAKNGTSRSFHPAQTKPWGEGATVSFENISMFGQVYRNMQAVENVTSHGKIRQITFGQNKVGKPITLDAFWVESALSYAVGADSDVRFERKGRTVNAYWKERKIASVLYSDGGTDQKSSPKVGKLAAQFMSFEWPLHPDIIQEFSKNTQPIERLEFLTYGPHALKGERHVWQLMPTEAIKNKALKQGFPLPRRAKIKANPMAMMIGEVLRGHAPQALSSRDETQIDLSKQDSDVLSLIAASADKGGVGTGQALYAYLQQNPYSLPAYLALAEYSVQVGDIDTGWLIFDALRTSLPYADLLSYPLTAKNQMIAAKAPQFFSKAP